MLRYSTISNMSRSSPRHHEGLQAPVIAHHLVEAGDVGACRGAGAFPMPSRLGDVVLADQFGDALEVATEHLNGGQAWLASAQARYVLPTPVPCSYDPPPSPVRLPDAPSFRSRDGYRLVFVHASRPAVQITIDARTVRSRCLRLCSAVPVQLSVGAVEALAFDAVCASRSSKSRARCPSGMCGLLHGSPPSLDAGPSLRLRSSSVVGLVISTIEGATSGSGCA